MFRPLAIDLLFDMASPVNDVALGAAAEPACTVNHSKLVTPAKAKSWWWGVVIKLYADAKARAARGDKDAHCIVCHSDLAYNKCSGNLEKHANLHLELKGKPAPGQAKLEATSIGPARVVVRWVVQTYQPLSAVEQPAFKDMWKYLNPRAQLPTRPELVKELRKVEKQARSGIHKAIRGCYVAITSDAWQSGAGESYLSLTAHLLTDTFELLNLPLDCVLFSGTHTGERILEKTLELLEKNGIDVQDVTVYVVDNGANVQKAGRLADFDCMSCTPHTIQLTINKILDCDDVFDALREGRKAVGTFKHSAKRLSELVAVQKVCGMPVRRLVQDVATRWSSALAMVISLVQNRNPVETVLKNMATQAAAEASATDSTGSASKTKATSTKATSAPAAAPEAAPEAATEAAATAASPSIAAPTAVAATAFTRTRTRLHTGTLARANCAEAPSGDDYSSSDDGSVDFDEPSGVYEPRTQASSDSSSSSSSGTESEVEPVVVAASKRKGKGNWKKQPASKVTKQAANNNSSSSTSAKQASTKRKAKQRKPLSANLSKNKRKAAEKNRRPKRPPHLTTEQWTLFEYLVLLLQPFADAQKLLEGEMYITISWLPFHIAALRSHLELCLQHDSNAVRKAAQIMLDDFNERWVEWPRAVLIAALLDPRTKKLKCFDAQPEVKSAAWQHVNSEMEALFQLQQQRLQQRLQQQAQDATAADNSDVEVTSVTAGATATAGGTKVSNFAAQCNALNRMLASDSDSDAEADRNVDAEPRALLLQRMAAEVKLYKQEQRLKAEDNPLQWWREHARDYPLLAAVARKWLSVPASSAASERVFSSAGLVVTKKRNRLKADKVATIVFLKTAWPTLTQMGIFK
jgi:hypothetical protein